MYIDAEIKKEISSLLRKKLKEAGVTDKEFMRRHGIQSESYFNQVKNGTYGDKYPRPDYWSQIAAAVGHAQDKYWKHFEFGHYANIMGLCSRAHQEREAWVMDGPTGYGKSYALGSYYRHPPQEGAGKVYYYRASDEHLRPADIMSGLLSEMGVRNAGLSLAGMTAKAIEVLSKGGLLIIDECEFLSNACLKQVRKLVYETEGRCGMIICGAGIADRVGRLASRKDALRNGWAQFWSRLRWNVRELGPIGYAPDDQEVTDRWAAEVRRVCHDLGIKDSKSISWLVASTRNYRDLNRIITKVLHIADTHGEAVSLQMLDGATGWTMDA
jgi:hypothetical protein